MTNCKDPACVDGYLHEDGDVSVCDSCARRAYTAEQIERLDRQLGDLAHEIADRFPNRAIRRAALGGRHERAAWLWDRHEEREMSRS